MKKYISRFDTNAVVRTTDNMIIGPEHTEEWSEYQQWLSEGNVTDFPDSEPQPIELTPEQKLANAGLTVDELKTLLGIK